MSIEKRFPKILAMLVASTSAVLLLGGADAWYYADDFGIIPDLDDSVLYNLISSIGAGFYRPIQSMALELQIEMFGWSTVPLHIAAIVLHLLCGAIVYYWTRKVSGSDWGGMISASLFLLSPISVYPVLGNDTISQVGATVLGFLGFVLGSDTRHDQSRWKGGLAGSSLACAFFFKETAVAYPILLVAFVLWDSYDRKKITGTVTSIFRNRKVSWLVATLVAGVALYFVLRIVATHQSVGSSSNYAFSANPIHIIRNALFTFGGMAVGGSYVDIFRNLQSGRWLALTPSVLMSVTVIGAVIWGAWKNRKLQTVIVIFLLSVLALGPLLFMRFRPSPLYLYGGLPFFASAAGIGIARFFERGRVNPKIIVGVIMTLFFLLQASGSHSLVNLMVTNGNQSKSWFSCLRKVAQNSEKRDSIAVFLRGKNGGPFTAQSEDRVARGTVDYVDRMYENVKIYEVEERDTKHFLIYQEKCKRINNK